MPDGYAMLMRYYKAETALHGCYCLGDMALHMRGILAELCSVTIPEVLVIYQTREGVSHQTSFKRLRGVWISDETHF